MKMSSLLILYMRSLNLPIFIEFKFSQVGRLKTGEKGTDLFKLEFEGALNKSVPNGAYLTANQLI